MFSLRMNAAAGSCRHGPLRVAKAGGPLPGRAVLASVVPQTLPTAFHCCTAPVSVPTRSCPLNDLRRAAGSRAVRAARAVSDISGRRASPIINVRTHVRNTHSTATARSVIRTKSTKTSRPGATWHCRGGLHKTTRVSHMNECILSHTFGSSSAANEKRHINYQPELWSR